MPLDEQTSSHLANLFSALSDPTRLRIIELLLDCEQSVGAIAEQLGTSESAVSHQLRGLRLQRIVRAMEQRGFEVRSASTVSEGVDLIRQKPPAFAIVDMRLEDGNGLDVIAELSRARADSRAIVLTGDGNSA